MPRRDRSHDRRRSSASRPTSSSSAASGSTRRRARRSTSRTRPTARSSPRSRRRTRRTSIGPPTPRRPPSRRGSTRRRPSAACMLLKLADAIEARADELGRLESKNAGKPVGAAIDEIPVVVDNLRFFAGARAGDGGQGGQRVHGRPHLDDPPRAGRRRRLDRAVELPDHDGRLEDRAGPRGRQHGHPQAVGPDAADRPRPRPRSPPTSCRRASSTSSPARARRSATRSSATRRSG